MFNICAGCKVSTTYISALIIVICILTYTKSAIADISMKFETSYDMESSLITISGDISKSDLEKYKSVRSLIIPNENRIPPVVMLNSTGGNVAVALELGKLLREDYASVYVFPEHECSSSCVFLLAAGVERYVAIKANDASRVGIHRPYLADDKNLTIQLQKARQTELERKVKNYLINVNILTSLYDYMWRIPPQEIKYLNKDDLTKFGLNQNDPYFDDAEVAKKAANLGITSLEYRKRYAYYIKQSSKHMLQLQQLEDSGALLYDFYEKYVVRGEK
ncbi:hypothetical protein MTYP_00791 [Methylophilaceae bacterium]|nr:hypothetical protein MTYP_00791 [Methylophilaceae bacterium]